MLKAGLQNAVGMSSVVPADPQTGGFSQAQLEQFFDFAPPPNTLPSNIYSTNALLSAITDSITAGATAMSGNLNATMFGDNVKITDDENIFNKLMSGTPLTESDVLSNAPFTQSLVIDGSTMATAIPGSDGQGIISVDAVIDPMAPDQDTLE